MEIVPATSITIPLMGKYILFTMVMVSLSVFISVVTLNVRFRSAGTHQMSRLTRALFFRILPKFLCMDAPGPDVSVTGVPSVTGSDQDDDGGIIRFSVDNDAATHSDLARLANPFKTTRNRLNPTESDLEQIYGNSYVTSSFIGVNADLSNFCKACSARRWDASRRYPPHMLKALDGTAFVAKHMKEDDESNKVSAILDFYPLLKPNLLFDHSDANKDKCVTK